MALALGLKLKIQRMTSALASVITTNLQAWHKFTATTWSGSNRLPDSSPVATNTAAMYTGRGLDFDGVNDVVTVGATGVTVKTVVFYAYPDTTTQSFMQLQSTGAVRIQIASGTLSATGFTSPTLYVNGAASSTVAALSWQMIAVTSATGVSASNVLFGQQNTTFYSGGLSNVKFFSTELSSAQIAELYANPEQALPTGSVAADLVGWWPMVQPGTISLNGGATKVNGAISGATKIINLPSPVQQVATSSMSSPMWFDGSNDYISIPSIDLTGDFTIYAIVSNIFLNENHICGDDSTADTFRVDKNSNKITVRLNNVSYAFNSAGVTNDLIHHIAVKRSGSTISVFCDNTSLGTATDSANFLIQRIGSGYLSWYFGGLIHSMAVFSNSLASLELTEIYAAGNELNLSSNYGNYTSSSNLLGYWRNGGNTSADWVDYSTAGKNGTVNGSPEKLYVLPGAGGKDYLGFTLTKPNNGYFLANGNDYASIADAATLDITTSITLEAWVKPFAVSSAQTMIGKNGSYALGITSAGKPVFTKWTSAASTATATTTTTVTADTWTHLAATYDGANVKLYINGALDTTTAVTGAIDATSADVLLGAKTTSTELFNGYIDSAKIYDTAFTAAQVANNYAAETADYQ